MAKLKEWLRAFARMLQPEKTQVVYFAHSASHCGVVIRLADGTYTICARGANGRRIDARGVWIDGGLACAHLRAFVNNF